jgi:hypothetical protein
VSSAPTSPAAPRIFRLPRSAYLIVLFLVFGTVPLAFGTNKAYSVDDLASGGTGVTGFAAGPRTLLLLIPVVAALLIARTATVVGPAGIRVRALLGSRMLPWQQLRGLSVGERAVYAVTAQGSVRLPCVRVADLADLAAASGGRLPKIERPVPRFAPSRHRR